jgi:hypothetical protein
LIIIKIAPVLIQGFNPLAHFQANTAALRIVATPLQANALGGMCGVGGGDRIAARSPLSPLLCSLRPCSSRRRRAAHVQKRCHVTHARARNRQLLSSLHPRDHRRQLPEDPRAIREPAPSHSPLPTPLRRPVTPSLPQASSHGTASSLRPRQLPSFLIHHRRSGQAAAAPQFRPELGT